MPIQIQNARVLTPFSQQDGAVLVTGDRILDVSRHMNAPRGTRVIDAKNLYLVPGYIDLHVHAGAGRNVMEGDAAAIRAIGDMHAREGTTTILPTVDVASMETMAQAIDAIQAAANAPCQATVAGLHLQGPYLAPTHLPQAVHPHLYQPGDAERETLLTRWADGLRIVGMSPEVPGALALADRLQEQGVVASISHSDAGYEQMLSAVSHGFTDVTNIFTHCSSIDLSRAQHVPGVTESALAMDELTVQVVADGVRLPMALLQIIFRCKGAENILLVTGDRNANAPVTMASMVRNMVAAGVSLRVALRMATVNPARRIGLEQTKGRIGPGYDADLLLLDEALNVMFCMAKGEVLLDRLAEVEPVE